MGEWRCPDLPGLDEPASDDPEEAGLWATVWGRYTRDLAGNVLSTLVLIALVATIIWVLRPRPGTPWAQRTGALGMLVLWPGPCGCSLPGLRGDDRRCCGLRTGR